ncbi:ferritin [candidate division KSB1 bacterium]|nr:ferritin [candidate division KSB1 bacterium]
MLTPAMAGKLNHQLQEEYYSSYLYLSMAAHVENLNLKGFAHWMRVQSDEERGHAMKFYEHLISNGAKVTLEAIQQPPAEFGSPEELFKKVLAHEQHITRNIHELYALALKENDYRTQVFLHWFITEQQEEEEVAAEILARIAAVENRMSSLLWIDKELKKRAGG